jgi:hypothetical protein
VLVVLQLDQAAPAADLQLKSIAAAAAAAAAALRGLNQLPALAVRMAAACYPELAHQQQHHQQQQRPVLLLLLAPKGLSLI